MRKARKKSNDNSIFPTNLEDLKRQLQTKFDHNSDLNYTIYQHQNQQLAVFYVTYLIDTNKVEASLLKPLLDSKQSWDNTKLLNQIPLSSGKKAKTMDDILKGILMGEVFIYIENEKEIVSYPLKKEEKRDLSKAETESLVLGPQVAFTESLATNMNLTRKGILSNDLVLEKIIVGEQSPKELRLAYLKSAANQDDINTMRQRLVELEVDEIEDSSVLIQLIEDSSSSIFPQFYETELPDRFSYSISKGRVGVLVENSPTGIIAPITLFSFLESTEDLYMRWNIGSFFRILRFIAMVISVLLTPMYVAVVTYHYEIIPMPLLITLGQSRANVPFPPIFEAMLLELLIELLREAGARLPTKVGQTMGIVGGVVVGTAAVQAGLTSNTLIILVTLSALASFTAPSYLMGTTIRVLRFPMIILGGVLGLIGIMFGICFLIIHLLKLTSLGRPYLSPVYPFNWQDLNKTLFRLPYNMQTKRFVSFRLRDLYRFDKDKARKKKDIDE
ncbi:spore germination protein [Virgibacillus salexigens]|uniref:spore germination protein n=1 Tax=Virgibacillus massiliensis TaxID=1462526 RepID=UPI0013689F8C|nr:spore germination protein [Virgibacillus massiliensis]MYL42871.1 spore germination protein [Virgibacillus massiliensis]